jgi:hypothetical protein
MYNDKYVFEFKTAEVLRIQNMATLTAAIFAQHNDNGKRHLRKDCDATLKILREAEAFVNANIGKTRKGIPTVYDVRKNVHNFANPPFRPDDLTEYRLARAVESLEHIYTQFNVAEQAKTVNVVLQNTNGGGKVKAELKVSEMYDRVRFVLAALRDNVQFWDEQIK